MRPKTSVMIVSSTVSEIIRAAIPADAEILVAKEEPMSTVCLQNYYCRDESPYLRYKREPDWIHNTKRSYKHKRRKNK